jgi:hypothetical protein
MVATQKPAQKRRPAMVDRITGLPDNVVGFSVKGKVTHQDYASVIIPEVEAHLARHPRLKLLYHVGPEFKGFETEAVWDDTKVGLGHLQAWERIAVVSDVEWLRAATKMLGILIRGEVRVFKNADLETARRWITEQS